MGKATQGGGSSTAPFSVTTWALVRTRRSSITTPAPSGTRSPAERWTAATQVLSTGPRMPLRAGRFQSLLRSSASKRACAASAVRCVRFT